MSNNLRCPVCGSQAHPFLKQDAVPVHQHLIFRDQQAAVHIQRGILTLSVCKSCEFVFNSTFDETKLKYSEQYDNTQLSSPYFQNYVNNLIHHLIVERNVKNAQIIEVGCGKGAFLRALVETDGTNNSGIGFDPSYIGPESDLDGRIRFEQRFYDEHCADMVADVIICRHVIEHIAEPVHFLRNIHRALMNSPEARLFFETPNFDWILRHHVVWDLFYEHCSYFTPESLRTAFEFAGFSVIDISSQFGGQYLWLEAVNVPSQHILETSEGMVSRTHQFAKIYARCVQEWQHHIERAAASYRLALWGAGAKGVTFANLVDPLRRYFSCVVDLNVAKQGAYLPGTGHPIISYPELSRYGIGAVVLLNPNYYLEVRDLLEANMPPVALINLGAK